MMAMSYMAMGKATNMDPPLGLVISAILPTKWDMQIRSVHMNNFAYLQES